MKNVDPTNFQKKRPEKISFQGVSMPDQPSGVLEKPEKTEKKQPRNAIKDTVRPSERPSVRTKTPPINKPIEDRETPANTYTVEIPEQRRKIRHPFDIYEDQLEALKKIQIAKQDKIINKKKLTLGDMTREALDNYIDEKIKKTPNIQLIRQQDNQQSE